MGISMEVFVTKLLQQIFLVGISTSIAIIIGIPLGIYVSRHSRARGFIVGFANILQTIPSLALLAFLLPFMGIGAKPAICALMLYALLPIIRNTLTGISEVPQQSLAAANGLGFTAGQRLMLVELPLAAPMIIAGIRTAVVINVGVATLAAFIGAGGLGDFITQGLSLNNTALLLTGAIPAAVLALILDFGIGEFEKSMDITKPNKRRHQFMGLGILTALISTLFVSAVVLYLPSNNNIVRIGSKNFTEQYILGNMMADLIQAKTKLTVERKLNLGTASILQQAMENHEIDMYPEYTGTAYLNILKQTKHLSEKQMYQFVKQAYQKQFHMTWLKPFGFYNNQAIAVTDSFAKKNHINTISDLINLAPQLTFGAPAEFLKRADGFPGLRKAYHLHFKTIQQLDKGLLYRALKNKDVSVATAFTTDGRIPLYHLKILKDDHHLFPAYYAAPIVDDSTLKKYPQIKKALAPLADIINNKTMQDLNYKVDVLKQSPAKVARDFLVKHHII